MRSSVFFGCLLILTTSAAYKQAMGAPITVEAESMGRAGAYVAENGFVTLSASTNATGTATTVFTGPTANYNVTLTVIDEAGGQPSVDFYNMSYKFGNYVFTQAPVGTTQTQVITLWSNANIKSGDTIKLIGYPNGSATARIDKIVFTPVSSGTSYTYEAEAMSLSGAYVAEDSYIRLAASTTATGTLTQTFGGATGNYDVSINVVDQAGGTPSVDFYNMSYKFGNYQYNLAPAGKTQAQTITIRNANIKSGDTFKIIGYPSGTASAIVDSVVFTPLASAPPYTSTIVSSSSGLCLEATGTTAGATVVQNTCSGAVAQKWTFQNFGGNQYEFISAATPSLCLNVKNASKADGAKLEIWNCSGGSSELWGFNPISSGVYSITNVNSGTCVDVSASSTSIGLQMEIWSCNGGTNQNWLIDSSQIPAQGGTPPPNTLPGTRDPQKWPFAQNSIWNTPIGSGAVYVPANLTTFPNMNPDPNSGWAYWAYMPNVDEDILVFHPEAGDVQLRHSTAGWSSADHCSASDNTVLASLPWPPSFFVPSMLANNSTAVLMRDGSVNQFQPGIRCQSPGYVTSYAATVNDITVTNLTGDGIRGAHGGSGLSTVGGSIRLGEFTHSGGPARHALKMVLSVTDMFRCDGANCWRWPALHADGSTTTPKYGYALDSNYNKLGPEANPAPGTALRMGALLALHKNEVICSISDTNPACTLKLETEPARMIAWTLQNYGAYVDDTTNSPEIFVSTELSPEGRYVDQFNAEWGYAFNGRTQGRPNDPLLRDWERIFEKLQVIDNNSASSIGGGGTPRQPLAPPFQ